MAIRWVFIIAGTLVLLAPSLSLADPKSTRGKVIDFDDELVEGMNKRPLDSLSQVGDAGKHRKKPHLYKKRAGFRDQTLETIYEVRYTQ